MTESNCIFVTEALHDHFSDYCVDLNELATSKHLTYLMTGYDGKYVLSQRPTYMRDDLLETQTEFLGDHYKAPEMPNSSTSAKVRVKIAVGRIANKVNTIIKRKGNVDDAPRLKWIRDQGDKTLRLDYDINADSIVFDIGGYEGQWASDIFSKYCCRILVFEPVTEYSKNIQERFRKNDRVQVHPFGLSDDVYRKLDISVNEDSSSIYQRSGMTEQIELKRATTFINESGIGSIDLMKINIEGGEYELLEDLLDSGLIERIVNIQVQFHDFVDDAENKMAKIQARLQRTHHPTYQYRFIWENWASNTQRR